MENGQRNSGRKKMVMQTSHASSLVQSVAFSWCPFFDVSLLHIPLACLDWHCIICSSRSWPEIVRMLPSNRSLLLVHWHDQSLGSCAGPSTQLGSIPPPIKAASFYAPPWAQHCFTPPSPPLHLHAGVHWCYHLNNAPPRLNLLQPWI